MVLKYSSGLWYSFIDFKYFKSLEIFQWPLGIPVTLKYLCNVVEGNLAQTCSNQSMNGHPMDGSWFIDSCRCYGDIRVNAQNLLVCINFLFFFDSGWQQGGPAFTNGGDKTGQDEGGLLQYSVHWNVGENSAGRRRCLLHSCQRN